MNKLVRSKSGACTLCHAMQILCHLFELCWSQTSPDRMQALETIMTPHNVTVARGTEARVAMGSDVMETFATVVLLLHTTSPEAATIKVGYADSINVNVPLTQAGGSGAVAYSDCHVKLHCAEGDTAAVIVFGLQLAEVRSQAQSLTCCHRANLSPSNFST